MGDGTEIQAFFQENFVGEAKLNVTLKSAGGASVNIDGPFEIKTFNWPERGERHTVLQPTWAKKRAGSKETNVHVHVPWDRLKFCRIQYTNITPLMPQECKISFFGEAPPQHQHADPVFWFYAFLSHPLVKAHPNAGQGYSEIFPLRA